MWDTGQHVLPSLLSRQNLPWEGHGHRSLAEKRVYNVEEDAHGWLVNQYSLSPMVSCLDLRVHVAVVVLLSLHVTMLSVSELIRRC